MDWIPAITTTSLLGVALWLGKNALLERLKRSVRHEFDEKLEGIKSEIREKEKQMDALRTGALSKAALPHYEEYIEKNVETTLHYLLDELESKLLLEIDNIVNGKEDDQESIENAAKILKVSAKLMEKNSELQYQ